MLSPVNKTPRLFVCFANLRKSFCFEGRSSAVQNNKSFHRELLQRVFTRQPEFHHLKGKYASPLPIFGVSANRISKDGDIKLSLPFQSCYNFFLIILRLLLKLLTNQIFLWRMVCILMGKNSSV